MKKLSTQQGCQGGQEYRYNCYCPECKAFNAAPHMPDCNGEKIAISATARIPQKNASKKVWDDFYKKFVLKIDLKEAIRKNNDRINKNPIINYDKSDNGKKGDSSLRYFVREIKGYSMDQLITRLETYKNGQQYVPVYQKYVNAIEKEIAKRT